jgi:Cu2+-exporting ATPase
MILESFSTLAIASKQCIETSDVVFDKMGTLSEDKLIIAVEEYVSKEGILNGLGQLLGLLSNNKHPVSVKAAAHLKSKGFPSPCTHQSLLGEGVVALLFQDEPFGQVI